MLGIKVVIKANVVDDIDDDMLDEMADEIDMGIGAINERLKEKFPQHLDELDWEIQ